MTRASNLGSVMVFAVLATFLGACHGTPPAPQDHIRFEHGEHLRSGLTCLQCHRGAAAASDVATGDAGAAHDRPGAPGVEALPILPPEALCKDCHTEAAERECRFCHTEPSAPGTYPRKVPELIFDHGPHVRELSGGCVGCHGVGQRGSSLADFEPSTPPMTRCTESCHAEDWRQMECSTCHRNLHRYAMEEVSVVRHAPGFSRRHGTEARANTELCAQCHDPSFCSECHLATPGISLEQVEPLPNGRFFVHAGDFVARHPVEARLEVASCNRCHGVEFCDGCHRESGIGGSVAPDSPHPPGWLDPASRHGHARAARSDITRCAACHESDAEQTCVPCHRVGGVTSNPHPIGFGSRSEAMTRGVCLACHAGAR